MNTTISRSHGRLPHAMRSLRFEWDIYPHALSSILISCGNTRVLVGVSIDNGVPSFLRGTNTGWLTAEYGMLPLATHQRTMRDSQLVSKNGRSVEISRFIGRALRTAIDLSKLGERTITIDCDVLQADGGTRVTSISGAFLALRLAQARMLERGFIKQPFIVTDGAAISIGVIEQTLILDPDYQEDSTGHADFNVVLTRAGDIIEIQGGAEKQALPAPLFNQVYALALQGVTHILHAGDAAFEQSFPSYVDTFKNEQHETKKRTVHTDAQYTQKASIFSLKNRLQL